MSSVQSGRSGAFDPSYVQRGETVGQYRILERLGQGGMGATYLAERDGASYALKLATFDVALRPEDRRLQVARVKREAGILQQLEHPNIVRTHELGFWPSLEKGYPYIVMDYIAGACITDWRQQVRPSARLLSSVFAKLCRGLEELHRLGIYHRDLKGQNVMVRAIDQEPIIIDFGIARAASAKTMTRQLDMLGTYVNFPPEYCAWAISGRASLEPFAHTAVQELWTVGLLAYELFTGRVPFPYKRAQFEMYESIQRVQPPLPSEATPGLPPALDAIIMSALEKDPAKRCQTAAAFAGGLELALAAADATWDVALSDGHGPDSDVSSFARDSDFSAISSEGPRKTRAERGRSSSTPSKVSELSLSALGFIMDDDGEPSSVSANEVGPVSQSEGVASSDVSPLSDFGLIVADGAPDDDAPPSGLEPLAIAGADDDAPPSVVESVASSLEPPSAVAAVPAVASAPAAFVPPSAVAAAAPTFVPPADEVRAAPRRTRSTGDAVPSAVRRMGEQLQGNRTDKRLPTPLLVVGGLGLACAFVLFLARQGSPAPEAPAASSLESLELEATAGLLPARSQRAASQAALPSPLPPPADAVTQSPAMTGDGVAVAGAASRPASRRARKPNADEAGVDAILQESFGGKRPVLSESGRLVEGASPAAAPKRSASFIKMGQSREQDDEGPSAEGTRGVPFGAHLQVKLQSPLHSDTARNGMVEARFVAPYRNREGAILIPARSRLYGSAQPDGTTGRFLVKFTRLRLPDDSVLEVDLAAVDVRDELPGLRAVLTRPDSSSEGSVLEDVAAGAAQTVLGTVSGGTGQDVVRGAGQALTREATKGGSNSSGARSTLTLGAGLTFRVVANKAF